MGKLGDLFVKLGLKNDEFKRGIEESKRETSGFGEGLKRMATTAKLAWAAVGAAVIKFAKDFIDMTQKIGDSWTIAMEGLKSGYGAFIRGLANGEGFQELFSNIREAIRLGREAAEQLDEVFERKISYGYTAAETQKEIANLSLIMRDRSKSDKERLAAADAIIAKEEELANLKREVWEQEADAQRKIFRAATGLTDSETDTILRHYNQNRYIIEEARSYLAESARLKTTFENLRTSATLSGGQTGSNVLLQQAIAAKAAWDDFENSISGSVKNVAELVKKYDKVSDEIVENMARAEVAVIEVDTEAARRKTRAVAMRGSLTDAGMRESGTQEDKVKEIARRAADAAKKEVQLLREKYDEEKALLKEYGLDTTDLHAEYVRNLFDILDKEFDKGLEKLKDKEPVKLDDLIDLGDIDYVDTQLESFLDGLLDASERAQEYGREFADAVTVGFSDATQMLMDSLAELQEFNGGAVVQALLTPLADLAVKAGEIIMAEGIATIAAKSALETFGATGWGAVAAGAALISAGAAAKAGLAALASGGTATTSNYTGQSAGAQPTQQIESELTIYVKGTLKGSDIVLAAERTQTNWSR